MNMWSGEVRKVKRIFCDSYDSCGASTIFNFFINIIYGRRLKLKLCTWYSLPLSLRVKCKKIDGMSV
jgi:hypothetical protein